MSCLVGGWRARFRCFVPPDGFSPEVGHGGRKQKGGCRRAFLFLFMLCFGLPVFFVLSLTLFICGGIDYFACFVMSATSTFEGGTASFCFFDVLFFV